jgi:hypothetical protein
MRIPPILWCIFYSLHLIQSEKCVSKYFKILQGRKRLGTPVETISTKNEIMCVMRCTNGCQAINFINNAELQRCELFSEHQVGQIINDELSAYYYALDIGGRTVHHLYLHGNCTKEKQYRFRVNYNSFV